MVVGAMPYKVTATGLSDVGLVRQNNEDFWSRLEEHEFYVLADGMGGHRAGEVASKEAVTLLCEIVGRALATDKEELSLEEMHGVIQFAIEQVNEAVYALGHGADELKGMGTTLCCIYFHPQGLIYGHVGDSRIYRMRRGILEQLTKDDSLMRELMEMGHFADGMNHEFAYKSIITKAIGTESYIEPTVHISEVMNGDEYLMCTDGLSDMVSLNEMQKILKTHSDEKKAAKNLVAAAKEKGGYDNITVVLMKVHGSHEKKDLSR